MKKLFKILEFMFLFFVLKFNIMMIINLFYDRYIYIKREKLLI